MCLYDSFSLSLPLILRTFYDILSLTRGRRCSGLIRYGILYDIGGYSVTTGRQCNSLGGVCTLRVLLMQVVMRWDIVAM